MLLDRPYADALTLYPRATGIIHGGREEVFYTRAQQVDPQREIAIRVAGWETHPQVTWLADRVAAQLNDLLRLGAGWDGHRARPVTMDAAVAAAKLIFVVTDEQAIPPLLFPLVDGGVQVEWHAGTDVIEIEVGPAGLASGYVAVAGAAAFDDLLDPGHSETNRDIRAAVRLISDRVSGSLRAGA